MVVVAAEPGSAQQQQQTKQRETADTTSEKTSFLHRKILSSAKQLYKNFFSITDPDRIGSYFVKHIHIQTFLLPHSHMTRHTEKEQET